VCPWEIKNFIVSRNYQHYRIPGQTGPEVAQGRQNLWPGIGGVFAPNPGHNNTESHQNNLILNNKKVNNEKYSCGYHRSYNRHQN